MNTPIPPEVTPEFQELVNKAKESIEEFLKRATLTLEEKGLIERNQPNYIAFPDMAFTWQILPEIVGSENVDKVFNSLIETNVLIETPVEVEPGEYITGFTMKKYNPINN